jgi:choline transport protein
MASIFKFALTVFCRCSGISLAAVTLVGLIQFWQPQFAGSQWQIYLIYVASAAVTRQYPVCSDGLLALTECLPTVCPLFAMPKKISWTVQGTLYLSVLGCVIYLIVVCSMHQSTQPGSFVTRSDLGTSGWSSGVAWLLGIANAMYAFGGTDAGMSDVMGTHRTKISNL